MQITNNNEDRVAEIETENLRKANAVRNAGGAASASLKAMAADGMGQVEAPTASSSKKAKKAGGARSTLPSVRRGSAYSRGTNLSI